MKMNNRALSVFLTGLLLAGCPTRSSHHFPVGTGPYTLEHSIRSADYIFEGKVKSIEFGTPTDEPSLAHSFVTYEILQVFKGPELPEITIRVLGGALPGGEYLQAGEFPRFDIGDTDILFLKGNTQKHCPLTQCGHSHASHHSTEGSGSALPDSALESEIFNEADIGRYRLIQGSDTSEPYVYDEFGSEVTRLVNFAREEQITNTLVLGKFVPLREVMTQTIEVLPEPGAAPGSVEPLILIEDLESSADSEDLSSEPQTPLVLSQQTYPLSAAEFREHLEDAISDILTEQELDAVPTPVNASRTAPFSASSLKETTRSIPRATELLIDENDLIMNAPPVTASSCYALPKADQRADCLERFYSSQSRSASLTEEQISEIQSVRGSL